MYRFLITEYILLGGINHKHCKIPKQKRTAEIVTTRAVSSLSGF